MPLKLPDGMTAAYENSASSSYLVIDAGEAPQIAMYQVDMLEVNRPGSMLNIEARYKNDSIAFNFDITSRLPLEFLLKRKKLGRNEFIKLLADISRPLIDCEGFLLRDSGFLLDPGFIYVNPESFDIYLVYLPVRSEENTAESFKCFISDLILHHAVIEETGCDNFLQRILGFVRRDVFNIRDFLGLLEELVYQPMLKVQERPESALTPEAAVHEKAAGEKIFGGKAENGKLRIICAVLSQVLIAAFVLSGRKLLEGLPGDTGVTYGAIALIILAADVLLFKRLFYKKAVRGEAKKAVVKAPVKSSEIVESVVPVAIKAPVQYKTELLGSSKPSCPVLQGKNSADFEEILIDRPDFIIGRLQDQVDHVCKNNAVGKVHAQITTREGTLRIRDLNSVNGTFVNNSRIGSNIDVEIKDSDMISLANSEYMLINK